jgi:hypothetical protein
MIKGLQSGHLDNLTRLALVDVFLDTDLRVSLFVDAFIGHVPKLKYPEINKWIEKRSGQHSTPLGSPVSRYYATT